MGRSSQTGRPGAGNSRREVLQGLTAVALTGLAASPACSNRSKPVLRRDRVRPPGALPETEFVSRCIRCARCAAVCPYRAVELLGLEYGRQAGTPVVDVLDTPCYLCMACVEVCPTEALVPIELEETRMGLATVNRETCIAWNGRGLCRTCYSVCPLRDRAITNWEFKPEVVEDTCTGCGICVHACPVVDSTGEKPIHIEPPAVKT